MYLAFFNNIERYVEAEKNYTEIYFKGGKVLKIRAPYTTIDNQITKCIKKKNYLIVYNIQKCNYVLKNKEKKAKNSLFFF